MSEKTKKLQLLLELEKVAVVEEKDKIIDFQQKLIVFLIKVVVLMSFFGFLTIGFLGYQYFNDDFCSTNITGNNNQSTNGNTLDSSSIEEN